MGWQELRKTSDNPSPVDQHNDIIFLTVADKVISHDYFDDGVVKIQRIFFLKRDQYHITMSSIVIQ